MKEREREKEGADVANEHGTTTRTPLMEAADTNSTICNRLAIGMLSGSRDR